MRNPRLASKQHDAIVVAGVRSPGRARFPNGPPKRLKGYDKQAGQGSTGGRLVKKNEPAIEFDVEILCFEDEQYEAWDEFQRVLDTPTDVTLTNVPPLPPGYVADITAQRERANRLAPAEKAARIRDLDAQVAAKRASLTTSTKEIRALQIDHPLLAQIDCRAVVVAGYRPPSRDLGRDIPGLVSFIEHRPLSTTGAGSGTVNGTILGGGNPRNGIGGGADPNQDLKDAVAAKTREYDAA